MVGDPVVEKREWRLRRAAAGNRIPRGPMDVEGATTGARGTAGGAELPRGRSAGPPRRIGRISGTGSRRMRSSSG